MCSINLPEYRRNVRVVLAISGVPPRVRGDLQHRTGTARFVKFLVASLRTDGNIWVFLSTAASCAKIGGRVSTDVCGG